MCAARLAHRFDSTKCQALNSICTMWLQNTVVRLSRSASRDCDENKAIWLCSARMKNDLPEPQSPKTPIATGGTSPSCEMYRARLLTAAPMPMRSVFSQNRNSGSLGFGRVRGGGGAGGIGWAAPGPGAGSASGAGVGGGCGEPGGTARASAADSPTCLKRAICC